MACSEPWRRYMRETSSNRPAGREGAPVRLVRLVPVPPWAARRRTWPNRSTAAKLTEGVGWGAGGGNLSPEVSGGPEAGAAAAGSVEVKVGVEVEVREGWRRMGPVRGPSGMTCGGILWRRPSDMLRTTPLLKLSTERSVPCALSRCESTTRRRLRSV